MDSNALLQQLSVKKIIAAFDLLPDILFWVKDTHSRIVYANCEFVKHQGYKHLEQVLDKTDYDFSPKHLAHQFVTDDKQVLAGHQVTDRLELNYTSSGDLGWFSTSKRVLTDNSDNMIGTYGVTRHLEKTSKALSNINAVQVPVQYIREHYNENITLEKLADVAHLSVSALERRFKKHLANTPNQFINKIRLENARKLLVETANPIADVAYQCGFSNPSYFSKQFQLLFGEPPSKLRKQING